jgi:hypothetical protein
VPARSDAQACISFNPSDTTELLTNGPRTTVFWRLRPDTDGAAAAAEQQQQQQRHHHHLSHHVAVVRPADLSQRVGEFVASTFIPGSSQVSAAAAGWQACMRTSSRACLG